MAISQNRFTFIIMGFFGFLIFFPLSHCDSIHDLLSSRGLPPGLLPKAVKSFNLDENGLLEVILDQPCLAKFENRVHFESVIRGNLSYGELTGLMGLSQEELFLWLPVKDIIVDDPSSGLILFDIGVVHKQFSLSLFEYPPDCKPEEDQGSSFNLRTEHFNWVAGPWMSCSSPCDGGIRYRDVECFGQLEDMSIPHYPADDSRCLEEDMPPRQEPCNLRSCAELTSRDSRHGRMSGWLIMLLVLMGVVAVGCVGFAGYTLYKRRTSAQHGFVYIMLDGYS